MRRTRGECRESYENNPLFGGYLSHYWAWIELVVAPISQIVHIVLDGGLCLPISLSIRQKVLVYAEFVADYISVHVAVDQNRTEVHKQVYQRG